MAAPHGPGAGLEPHQLATSPSPRPAYRQWRYLSLIAVGGAIGTGLRETLRLLIPEATMFPTTTFVINMSGAFLLGLLFEILAPSRPNETTRHRLRLLGGTGFLGGFTTYSALAATTAQLVLDHLLWWALCYALGTTVIGTGLSAAGIVLGRLITRYRKHHS